MIRDSKTGRFAKKWKGKRWPGRFFDYGVAPERVRQAFERYAEEGNLWENFGLTKGELKAAKSRFKNIWVVTFEADGYRFAFQVDIKTGKVRPEKRAESPGAWHEKTKGGRRGKP